MSLKYTYPRVLIKFTTDNKIVLDRDSKEYHAIAFRVDYYAGKLSKTITESATAFDIDFTLAGM